MLTALMAQCYRSKDKMPPPQGALLSPNAAPFYPRRGAAIDAANQQLPRQVPDVSTDWNTPQVSHCRVIWRQSYDAYLLL